MPDWMIVGFQSMPMFFIWVLILVWFLDWHNGKK